MKTPTLVLAWACAVVLGACSPPLVPVRVDACDGATVTLLAGVGTPEIVVKAPFIARFEGTSLGRRAAYHLELRIDAVTAKALGGTGPVTLRGLLWVNKPTNASRDVTLRLLPTPERVTALLRGEVTEISAFVSDPAENTQLALLVLTKKDL